MSNFINTICELAFTDEGKNVFRAYYEYNNTHNKKTKKSFIRALQNLDALGSALGMRRFLAYDISMNDALDDCSDILDLLMPRAKETGVF